MYMGMNMRHKRIIVRLIVAVSLLPFVIVIKPILDGIFFNKYSVITNIATKDVFSNKQKPYFFFESVKV